MGPRNRPEPRLHPFCKSWLPLTVAWLEPRFTRAGRGWGCRLRAERSARVDSRSNAPEIALGRPRLAERRWSGARRADEPWHPPERAKKVGWSHVICGHATRHHMKRDAPLHSTHFVDSVVCLWYAPGRFLKCENRPDWVSTSSTRERERQSATPAPPSSPHWGGGGGRFSECASRVYIYIYYAYWITGIYLSIIISVIAIAAVEYLYGINLYCT